MSRIGLFPHSVFLSNQDGEMVAWAKESALGAEETLSKHISATTRCGDPWGSLLFPCGGDVAQGEGNQGRGQTGLCHPIQSSHWAVLGMRGVVGEKSAPSLLGHRLLPNVS